MHPLGRIHHLLLPKFNNITNKTQKKPNLSVLMSWSCKICTFINSNSPLSPKPTCQICLSPRSPPPSSSRNQENSPTWPCKACTFLNPFKNISCDICGTRAPVSSISSFEDFDDCGLDEGLDSQVGSVFRPLMRACKRKLGENSGDGDQGCVELGAFRGVKAKAAGKDGNDGDDCMVLDGFQGFTASKEAVTVAKEETNSAACSNLSSFKILSYNVWFREDLKLQERMKAIGDLIQLHTPDIICFQEVTPDIYGLFCLSSWWKAYYCSVPMEVAYSKAYFCMLLSKMPVKSFSTRPFHNSIMGRELSIMELELQNKKPLVVATSHLESPCPAPPKWDQMFSKERVEQAKMAVDFLKKHPNVIFGGDMNWDDKLDGQFPLANGWIDPWAELKSGDDGWTYDTKSNQMLSGNRKLQKRLDRFACHLRDFKISKIDMIGKEAIPGLSYTKVVGKQGKTLELPVLPSDHYGLILTITAR